MKKKRFSGFWGRGEMMVTAAHRYSLGRASYVVSDCIDWLISFWDDFDQNTRDIVVRDTEEAIEKGLAGSKMDEESWKHFLKSIRNRRNDVD